MKKSYNLAFWIIETESTKIYYEIFKNSKQDTIVKLFKKNIHENTIVKTEVYPY